jgi:hypothetical protein
LSFRRVGEWLANGLENRHPKGLWVRIPHPPFKKESQMPNIAIVEVYGYCYECEILQNQITKWESVTEEELKLLSDYIARQNKNSVDSHLSMVKQLDVKETIAKSVSYFKEQARKQAKEIAEKKRKTKTVSFT